MALLQQLVKVHKHNLLVKMMILVLLVPAREDCQRSRRQPIRAARARQTTTNVPIAHQPLVGGVKQKDPAQASATESKKELLTENESSDRVRIKDQASGKRRGGLVEILLFWHHCAETAMKHPARKVLTLCH